MTITKPFNPRELVARVKALLHRTERVASSKQETLHVGDLTIDPGSREIIQAHGGTIKARSKAGQGSVFVVKLPLARPDDSTLARRQR